MLAGAGRLVHACVARSKHLGELDGSTVYNNNHGANIHSTEDEEGDDDDDDEEEDDDEDDEATYSKITAGALVCSGC